MLHSLVSPFYLKYSIYFFHSVIGIIIIEWSECFFIIKCGRIASVVDGVNKIQLITLFLFGTFFTFHSQFDYHQLKPLMLLMNKNLKMFFMELYGFLAFEYIFFSNYQK